MSYGGTDAGDQPNQGADTGPGTGVGPGGTPSGPDVNPGGPVELGGPGQFPGGGGGNGGEYGGTGGTLDPSTGLYDFPAGYNPNTGLYETPAPTDVSANLADFGYSGSSLEESTPTGGQYSPVGVNLAGPTLSNADVAAAQLFSGGAAQVPATALQDFANLTGIDLTPSDFGVTAIGSNPTVGGIAVRIFADAAKVVAGPIGLLFNEIISVSREFIPSEFFADGPGATGYGANSAVNELQGGGPEGEGNGGGYSTTPLAQATAPGAPSFYTLQFPAAVNPFTYTLPSVAGGVAALPLYGGAGGGGGGTGTPLGSNTPAAASTFPWLWVLLAAALAVGGYLWWRAHHKKKSAANPAAETRTAA